MNVLTQQPSRSAGNAGGPGHGWIAGRLVWLALFFLAACALAAEDESLTQLIQNLPSNSNSLPSDQVINSQYLDMALARLGTQSHERKVADHLTGSTNITVRVCAVVTLRRLGKTTLRPALQKALRDSYHRTSGSDVGPPRDVYPVRTVAADALIDLGENPQEVRSKAKEP